MTTWDAGQARYWAALAGATPLVGLIEKTFDYRQVALTGRIE
jgi:hypothetical protein